MKYKVWIYGTPFSGKSYFADTFPKPFLINTDGNMQFYKNADGVQVSTYNEFVKALENFDTKKYDTLIIDVLDHIYDMCREKFLEEHGIEHESDLISSGANTYGKGWTLLREQFWYMISKIRNIDTNLVLISHDDEKEEKGKLGTTKTIYAPATIPKPITKKLTGIMHFVGHCYRDNNDFKISFGNNDNELSGYRLPIENKVINNNFEEFKKNIIIGE